jgi:hypothetical protein
MTDNQQARDFSQDFFPKPEAKIVGGLMSLIKYRVKEGKRG